MDIENRHEVSYGYLEVDGEGKILHINTIAKKLLINDEFESNSLFQLVTDNEIKKQLHKCFMGKAKEFFVTINKQPHLFLFNRISLENQSERIQIYIFNIYQIQNRYENTNWNQNIFKSIGEMAAGIAHEVRNPLTAVKGFLQLMHENYKHDYMDIAQSELDRAIQILNDLMSVSKPEFFQEEKTTLDLCNEIESILLLFQNHFYNIKVKKQFHAKTVFLMARKGQIKKAIFNLVKNAIEAMPDGGTLTIETTEEIDQYQLKISDTGVGIPRDKLRMIGTPFFTMKQEGKGMGLAQVFHAVQNNNGTIQVESEEQKGTTFIITFPKGERHTNIRGMEMTQATDVRTELSQFLKENLIFYTNQWIEYLRKNKNYLANILDEHGELDHYSKVGQPLMKIVSENLTEIRTEKIMDLAKEKGIQRAKMEFPIHLTWEIFLSSRGIIWNAIKTFFNENNKTLTTDEFFSLERTVNDIIDLYIDTYTSYYTNYKDELLKSHRETVEELSVPIIPITERTCILPIVGYVDTYRAKKIRERTLQRVKELKSEQLIIDISGVPYVDTAVVNHLFKIVKGIKLLGCSTTLTGISPEIADTMIELGIEIGDELKTKSDLQQALRDLKTLK